MLHTKLPLVVVLTTLAVPAQVQMQQIELAPPAVQSLSSAVFSTLPTADPARFGLTGGDVRRVNFDTTPANTPLPSGAYLTNEYASIGVVMNGIRISNSVYGGPASPPNATWFDQGPVFTFTVPVVAVGIINTSPDHDTVQLWSGPNGTGTLLLTFQDRAGQPINFNQDLFIGGRAVSGATIGSMRWTNASGNLELDELIFEVCNDVPSVAYGSGCPGAGNATLALGIAGCPRGGQTLSLDVSNALGGSLCAVVAGIGRASLPLYGSCSLLVDSPITLGIAVLSGTGPGNGSATFLQALPLGLANLTVNYQAAALDSTVPAGFVTSGGREVTLL